MAENKRDDVLTREDFDAGPCSVDEIEANLFLGNLSAATDIDWLRENKISHILTVDSCPLPRKVQDALPDIKLKYMQMTDRPKEDVLTSFEHSNQFIQGALDSPGGRVLVHCYFGMSRSATLVIAYVMKKHAMPFEQAFEAVRAKRKLIGPNAGFMAQLKLYEHMGFTIDCSNLQFKTFRLQIAADKVRKARILPQNYIDLIKPDPALPTAHPEPTVYRCRSCRRILANASNLLPHRPEEKQIWRNISYKLGDKVLRQMRIAAEAERKAQQAGANFCSKTYFVEPLAWMADIQHSVEGKLYCPKCKAKLGSFNWVSTCQCPCGSKIGPAFYLVPSKVDWSNAVQNVQSTV